MRLSLILLSLICFSNIYSQTLSKEEEKAILAEIKLLKKSPEKYKFMKESSEVKDIIINEQNNELSYLKKEVQKKDIKNTELRDSLLLMSKQELKYVDCNVNNSGLKYRVQIGLFRDLDLSATLDDNKYLVYEKVNNMHRYSIGNFATEAEAEAFKEQMRKMGIKDAFVSEYLEGERNMSKQ